MTREEAIDILRSYLMFDKSNMQIDIALNMAIEALSAEAVQGKWIEHKGEWVDCDFYPTKYECSQCRYYVDEGYDSIFCPNCGARMKGGAE